MRGTPYSDPHPFLARVRISDYRSIASCDVPLGALTVLAGYNASGKSNFLDAIRFVRDALASSPASALAARGGIERVLRRASGAGETPDRFGIEFALNLPTDDDVAGAPGEPRPTRPASYRIEIGRAASARRAGHVVLREECVMALPDGSTESFRVTPDSFESTPSLAAAADAAGRSSGDRLLLLAAALVGPFKPVESALLDMAFYDFDSTALRAVDDDARRSTRLGEDGSHIGHVLGLLAAESPRRKQSVDNFMGAVVPDLLGIDERREGDFSALQARFWSGENQSPLPLLDAVREGRTQAGDPHVEVFYQRQLSEGTVRAAGVFTALEQPDAASGAIPFLAIEEPELAIHPSRVASIFEAADSAARRTQVLLTTQSSDLLDDEYVRPEHLRMVEMVHGVSYIGELGEATRRHLQENPADLAELHRKQQLRPAQLTDGRGVRR